MSDTLFGGIIELSVDGQPITPNIILAYRSGEKLGVIQNVTSFVDSNHLMSAPEISFDVHKVMDKDVCSLWDDIKDFKLVYIPHLGHGMFNPWYEISVTIDENDETVMHVQGIHVQEAELSQLTLHDIQINTDIDIAREDYAPTIIYNPNDSTSSCLDRILSDKGSHYSIRYVSPSIARLQRTFEFDGDSIQDAFNEIAEEVEGLFIYGESEADDGQIHRTISLYDLNDVCLECGERGTFTNGVCPECGSTNITEGYGADSGIFITHENFAENINYSSNKDEVKNCFRLEAGDDLMTATIRNINPNGSQYIWYLSDDVRSDMSAELQDMLEDYDEMYTAYETTEEMVLPSEVVSLYNDLIDKYKNIDSSLVNVDYPVIGYSNLTDLYYNALNLHSYLKTTLAPMSAKGRKSTAEEEIQKLTDGTLDVIGVMNASTASASTVNSAILSYAKVFIDTSVFKLSIVSSSYANQTWTGVLSLTSYIDEEDTADTGTITITISDASATYMKCLIDKAMKKTTEDATGTVALFQKNELEFKQALSYYSVDNLNILASVARACLDVMISHDVATPGTSAWSDMYAQLYMPYYNKSTWIQEELEEREQEVKILRNSIEGTGLLDYIEKLRQDIANTLNLRDFLGETLWAEFSSFRRDDSYKNENFISDGLSDAEIIQNAKEFVSYAKKEIIKAGTIQHSINCNLYNLLLIDHKEVEAHESGISTYDGMRILTSDGDYLVRSESPFSGLVYKFKLGNWIILEIDGKIYRLRMTDYTINYDDLTNIDVDFSDVTFGGDSASDINSILAKAQSMATSYSSTVRQANKGSRANQQIMNMVANGLDLTNKKIINSAAHQDLVIDDSGLIMRAINEYDDDFNPEQVKIINHGLYYTTDNWLTVQTGLGKFIYYDPEDGQYKEDYGLIAHKIVGNIILGNELGIYNESGSFKADENGVTITSNETDDNTNLFTIQKDNGDGTYVKYVYIDENGNLRISGNSIEIENTNIAEYVGQKIGNIKVGGRNFLKFANTVDGCHQVGNTYTITEDVVDNIRITKVEKINATNGKPAYYEIYTENIESLTDGDVMTVSAHIYSTVAQTVSMYIANDINTNIYSDVVTIDLVEGWNNISGELTYAHIDYGIATSSSQADALIDEIDNVLTVTPQYALMITSTMDTYEYYAIDGIQLEKGNMKTDFHPAPEDTDQKLEAYSTTVEMRSAIEASANQIRTEVSENYISGEELTNLSTEVRQTARDLTAKITQGDETTMMRVYGNGVLIGKVGQSVCALVNANGSFDIVTVSWSGSTPTVTTTAAKFGSDNLVNGHTIATVNDLNMWYGTCTTGASVLHKTVECSGFSLAIGRTIHVYFQYGNTVASADMNVNGTGAKPIYVNDAPITSTFCPWNAGGTVTLTYDGNHWVVLGQVNLSADNIKAGTLEAVQINAANGSNLAGWIVNKGTAGTDSSLRSAWSTIGDAQSGYQYQTALKATDIENYGVIFIKNRPYGDTNDTNATYPFWVRPDGSAMSTDPTWKWHYGYDTNGVYKHIRMRRSGNTTDGYALALAMYNGESDNDFANQLYYLIDKDGNFLPDCVKKTEMALTALSNNSGFSITTGLTLATNRSFSYGSLVSLNITVDGVIGNQQTRIQVAQLDSAYRPSAEVRLYGIHSSAFVVHAWIETNGAVCVQSQLNNIGNASTGTGATVFVMGTYYI